MSFDSFDAFLAMGGHGLYVWLAYAAALAVVVVNVVGARLAYRRCLRDLEARGRRHRNPQADGTTPLRDPETV